MNLKTLFRLCLVFTPLMVLAMVLHGRPLRTSTTPHGILDLEFAGTVRDAQAVYTSWEPSLTGVAINNTLLDFLFIACYGCLLYAAALSISRLFVNGWRRTGKWFSRAAIAAAAFDFVENILMLRTLSGHISKEIVASTYMFASLKFILAALVLLYIIMYPVTKRFAATQKVTELA